MSDRERPRLILFPGLGVTGDLFAPQRLLSAIAQLEIVPWLRPNENETLRTYAHRLAATIPPSPDPSPPRPSAPSPPPPLFLAGVSFGAMLALEAAAVMNRKPAGVFMIGGARSGRELNPLLRLAATLARLLPDPLIEIALLASPLLVRMVGRPDREQRRFLLNLVENSLPWLTSWGGGAIVDWTAQAGPDPCPIHSIHGQHDHMIPLSRLSRKPDVIIPRAGHIINVTHPGIVNQFIAERMRERGRGGEGAKGRRGQGARGRHGE
jgi:pimeloyl-ACP methyl ester carboxylesterase